MSEIEVKRIESLITSLGASMSAGQKALAEKLDLYDAQNKREHEQFDGRLKQHTEDVNGLYLREENRDNRISQKLEAISKDLQKISNVELMVTQIKEQHTTLANELKHLDKRVDKQEADLNKSAIQIREQMNSTVASIERSWRADLAEVVREHREDKKWHDERIQRLEGIAARVGEFEEVSHRLGEAETQIGIIKQNESFLKGGWKTVVIIAGVIGYFATQALVIWSMFKGG